MTEIRPVGNLRPRSSWIDYRWAKIIRAIADSERCAGRTYNYIIAGDLLVSRRAAADLPVYAELIRETAAAMESAK